MAAPQQVLQHLQAQIEEQVAMLSSRRQQLSAAAGLPHEDARVQAQAAVLDSLRYEADLLNDKLMKLRASRQDLERELFGLKEKRIRLLDVINKLEDEEMALVSEVNSVMHHKRALLKQVPFFEERARASAALGVVQDYLLASCQCLQHLHGGGTLQAAPGWSGTARVPRPAVCWAARIPPVAGLASDSVSDMAADSWAATCGVAGGLERLRLEMQRQGSAASAGAGSCKDEQLTSSGASVSSTAATAAVSPGSSFSSDSAAAARPDSRSAQAAGGWQASRELLRCSSSIGVSQGCGSSSGSPTSKLQRQSSDGRALEAAREAAGRERGRHTRQASLSSTAMLASPPPPPPRRVRSHSMHSPVPLPMGGDTLPQLQLQGLAPAPAPHQLMLLQQQAAAAEQLQVQLQQQQLLQQQQQLLEQLMAGLQPCGVLGLTAAFMPPAGGVGLCLGPELARSGAHLAAQPVVLLAPDVGSSSRPAQGPRLTLP